MSREHVAARRRLSIARRLVRSMLSRERRPFRTTPTGVALHLLPGGRRGGAGTAAV